MARFANILGTIGNTPVVKINRLAPAGIDLWVKVEAFNPLGSIKDRLALGVIEAAAARVIRQPEVKKFEVALTLCTTSGLEQRPVAKRDAAAFKLAKKLDWGDAVEQV